MSQDRFPSGERPRESVLPGPGAAERARPKVTNEPVISERTKVIFSIAGLFTVAVLLIGIGIKYGEWSSERVAIAARDDRQDARLDLMEARWSRVEVYMATTTQSQSTINEKLENLLKINNTLLYSAGGERKKIPADN